MAKGYCLATDRSVPNPDALAADAKLVQAEAHRLLEGAVVRDVRIVEAV